MFPFSHLKQCTLPTYLQPTASGVPSYALVTGATDGIGLGFAHELLSRGFNVLIHGRNPTKLQTVKATLQETYPERQVHTLQADAANFDQADITRLVTEIRGIENMNLTILINNVGGAGVMKANFQTFVDHTPEEISALVNLNILFTAQLTHALLPLLLENANSGTSTVPAKVQSRKKSLIMNISSQAHMGIPYIPVYSGTKAFIHGFSHSIATEFSSHAHGQPIEVLEILVGSVQTQQNQIAKPTLWVPASRTMAKAALDRVGCGERHGIAAYWPHALQQASMGLLPEWLVDRVMVGALKGVVGKEERVW